MTDVRAHMMRPLESTGGIVIKDDSRRVEQPSTQRAENVQGSDVVWNSYYDLQNSTINHFLAGRLPRKEAPVDTSKKTSVIAGKEVKRMPVLDDFAEMMRRDDADNHNHMEGYVNPIGPAGGLDWFKATMLAAMIERGRIGIKETGNGIRGVYINRARAGNPFFRIWGGRTTLLVALGQWAILSTLFEMYGYSEPLGIAFLDNVVSAGQIQFVLLTLFLAYHWVHWRFYKRYSFVISSTLVDGWKARNMPTTLDGRWYRGRPAIHAINLAIYLVFFTVYAFLYIERAGWAKWTL